MNAVLRLLLIWLLALAVPVQGAAASMAFCSLAHQPASAGARLQPALADHAHGHDACAQHAHHGDGAVADAVADAAAPNLDDQHQCSACAACCSFGAMLGLAWSVPAPVFSPGVFVDGAPTVGPFSTDGPDRPPRPLPA